MEKKYIQPKTYMTQVMPQQIIATSPNPNSTNYSPDETVDAGGIDVKKEGFGENSSGWERLW